LCIFPNCLSIYYKILKSGLFFVKLIPILIENWSLKVPFFYYKWSPSPFFWGSLVLEPLLNDIVVWCSCLSIVINFVDWYKYLDTEMCRRRGEGRVTPSQALWYHYAANTPAETVNLIYWKLNRITFFRYFLAASIFFLWQISIIWYNYPLQSLTLPSAHLCFNETTYSILFCFEYQVMICNNF